MVDCQPLKKEVDRIPFRKNMRGSEEPILREPHGWYATLVGDLYSIEDGQ